MQTCVYYNSYLCQCERGLSVMWCRVEQEQRRQREFEQLLEEQRQQEQEREEQRCKALELKEVSVTVVALSDFFGRQWSKILNCQSCWLRCLCVYFYVYTFHF